MTLRIIRCHKSRFDALVEFAGRWNPVAEHHIGYFGLTPEDVRQELRHFSLRFLAAQRRLMNRCAQHLARVRVPVLLVQGRHDALVDPGAYPQLIAAASQTTAQHVVAPEGGHGASAVETMVAPLVAWIDARVRG